MRIDQNDDVLIKKLIELAVKGLEPLYDREQKLFIHRIVLSGQEQMPRLWSTTYTPITLLGLLKARDHGVNMTWFDETEIMQALIRSIETHDSRPGDIGLILWADAKTGGNYLSQLLKLMQEQVHGDALAQRSTTELSWFLTGLCYSQINHPENELIKDLAHVVYKAVVNNFGRETGLFSHLIGNGRYSSIRSNIGNFADQSYSIYSLSVFYEAYNLPESREIALQCANMICELQGGRGEWWWHYHSKQGGIASRFPVFAVHQDGMAPMALLKISGISGQDFGGPIRKGLDWLLGGNDMAVEMIDWERNVIWRDIERVYPLSTIRYGSYALAQAGLSRPLQLLESVPARKVNREMRPYETGWLLYAFADQLKVEGAT